MFLFQLLKLLITDPIQFLVAITLLLVPLLISITVHEWAHGFTAYKFGDQTPKLQGRLSLNPFAHLDPVGTLMLFVIGIGWAKPVQINSMNIQGRYKKLKLMLVALAGPLSNFILGTIFTFILYVLIRFLGLSSGLLVIILFSMLIRINFVLALFNLLPLPPLDGANIISGLMPDNLAELYFKIAPYSILILFVLIMTGGISFIFDVAQTIQYIILTMLDLFFKSA